MEGWLVGVGETGMAKTSDTPSDRCAEKFATLFFFNLGGPGPPPEPPSLKSLNAGAKGWTPAWTSRPHIQAMARTWTSRFWTSGRPMETCPEGGDALIQEDRNVLQSSTIEPK